MLNIRIHLNETDISRIIELQGRLCEAVTVLQDLGGSMDSASDSADNDDDMGMFSDIAAEFWSAADDAQAADDAVGALIDEYLS